MTRDEIIHMAREADLPMAWISDAGIVFWEDLERFANLVISHHVKETRVKPTASQCETFQQLAYQHGGIGDLCGTEFEFAALVAQHEREECAKRCERVADDYIAANGRHAAAIAYECAVAIRARGDKP